MMLRYVASSTQLAGPAAVAVEIMSGNHMTAHDEDEQQRHACTWNCCAHVHLTTARMFWECESNCARLRAVLRSSHTHSHALTSEAHACDACANVGERMVSCCVDEGLSATSDAGTRASACSLTHAYVHTHVITMHSSCRACGETLKVWSAAGEHAWLVRFSICAGDMCNMKREI